MSVLYSVAASNGLHGRLLQLVSLAALVFLTVLVTVGAEGNQQQMKKFVKECTDFCRPFKNECLKKLCVPKKEVNTDQYWWCIGGCVEHSGLCVKSCVDGELKKKN